MNIKCKISKSIAKSALMGASPDQQAQVAMNVAADWLLDVAAKHQAFLKKPDVSLKWILDLAHQLRGKSN